MLQVSVSILYLVNKIFLLFNKKSGWTIGALASATAIVYFLSISLYIFCALEVACFCIMIYGALGLGSSKRISILIYSVCAIVTFYLLLQIPETGFLEFLTSLLFMVAFVSLADRKRILGWILLGSAHLIMAFITYQKGQFFFAALQIISVLVCIFGVYYPSLTWENGPKNRGLEI